jgi:hypothetical protein
MPEMKKMIVVAAVFALTFVALRRFGPTVGKRAMAKCQEMMANHQGDVRAELADPSGRTNEEPTGFAAASGKE